MVDDNPTNLKLVSDVLTFEGHVVLTAEDAEAAQLVIADILPDLILMDIALPGMDGLRSRADSKPTIAPDTLALSR